MNRRGQLVLLAAATIALALVPVLLASLQLGYHADIDASATEEPGVRDVERTVAEVASETAPSVDGQDWPERESAADTFRDTLDNRLTSVTANVTDRGTVRQLSYNESAASSWIDDECPTGDGRAFGPCERDDGIVVQERAGEVHVVAVAIDVTVIDDERIERGVLVVEVRGG